MIRCPKCKTRTLSPTLLSAGLSAKGCQSCHGVLIDLLGYRAWADQKGIDAVDSPDPTIAASTAAAGIEDTSQAIACPNCSAVMSKFRLSETIHNQLDYCANCDEAWLDGGEWNQLENLGLRKSLGTVFTEPWQRRVREEIARHSRESILRDRFGSDYERISEFREWILRHPHYESALAWLGDRDDT